MSIYNNISYIGFIFILVLGIIYLYKTDELALDEINDKHPEESEFNPFSEEHISSKIYTEYINNEDEEEEYTGPYMKISNNSNNNNNNNNNNKVNDNVINSNKMPAQEGNWLCKIDHGGKEIELVKPIEPYISSRGSMFATLS